MTPDERDTELARLIPRPAQHAVIPKVHADLRRFSADLFTPKTMRIGPYHQDADSWLSTQEKTGAVEVIEGFGVDMLVLKEALDGVQSTARASYTHPTTHLPDEKFCSMLLHDGCYVLNLLFDYTKRTGAPSSSSSSTSNGSTISSSNNTVVRDIMYLLENQIPLFVMEEIHKKLTQERTALVCMAEAVEKLLQQQLYISMRPRVAPPTSSHLLDIVHYYIAAAPQPEEHKSTFSHLLDRACSYFAASRPSGQQERTDVEGPRTGRWRRATEYHRYGDLLFKPRAFDAGEASTILAVSLHGGSLSIPMLRVDSSTWTLLRNLMALEEHMEMKTRPVTAYCYFMSQVACTEEDVGLLRRAKVIDPFLSSDKSAAHGFSVLCDGMALDINNLEHNYLKRIWHELEKRCDNSVSNFKGFFRENYGSNLFYRVVFVFAIIVFVCQVVQSFYAVWAYHNPGKPHS